MEPKKQLKDDKHKISKRHVKIISKLAERFQRIDDNSGEIYTPHAEKMINQILELCCMNESQSRKLINKKHLNVSKVCQCESGKSCDCSRFFNSTDASLGYDSYRETYVYGYNFYQINSWSFHNKSELPIYLMMATGKQT